ncbi:MAG: hypothetical protein ACTHN5_18580 [Phycisphaerae bacterium]
MSDDVNGKKELVVLRYAPPSSLGQWRKLGRVIAIVLLVIGGIYGAIRFPSYAQRYKNKSIANACFDFNGLGRIAYVDGVIPKAVLRDSSYAFTPVWSGQILPTYGYAPKAWDDLYQAIEGSPVVDHFPIAFLARVTSLL